MAIHQNQAMIQIQTDLGLQHLYAHFYQRV